MRVERKYRCLDCSHKWRVIITLQEGGVAGALQDPACPKCFNIPAIVPDRVASPSITGTRSRAVDEAWRIAQEDYGLTNMRDNAQEGETAFITPPAQKPEHMTRPEVLWGGAAPTGPMQMPGAANLMAMGRQGAALAKAEG